MGRARGAGVALANNTGACWSERGGGRGGRDRCAGAQAWQRMHHMTVRPAAEQGVTISRWLGKLHAEA